MDEVIQWVRTAVSACTNAASEENKKEWFSTLEQVYCEFSENEQEYARMVIKNLEIADRIFVLSCFQQYMEEKDFETDLINSILEGEFDCYTGSLLEYNVMYYIKGRYEQKRLLHRQNVERWEKRLNISYPYLELRNRNQKRIVIITEALLEVTNAPTQVVLNHAYVLQEILGYEVIIFMCPTGMQGARSMWYLQAVPRSAPCASPMMKINYKGRGFIAYQINMTETADKEYALMFNIIYEWNPLFVLNMGIRNPVADLARSFTTVVSRELSTSGAVSEAQILLRARKNNEAAETEYARVIGDRQKQVFIEEKMPVLAVASGEKYMRSELGLPEDKFLIAIVGNRLENDIDEECVSVMEEIIKSLPECAFVLIGSDTYVRSSFCNPVFENRIFFLGYCEDLMKTYTVIDLYMNPKRNGGGWSSAMALTAGIPVVTLPDCDVAYNVGDDFIVPTYKAMTDMIGKCAADKAFYGEKKEQAKHLAAKNSEEKLVQYVKHVLRKVIGAMEGEA